MVGYIVELTPSSQRWSVVSLRAHAISRAYISASFPCILEDTHITLQILCLLAHHATMAILTISKMLQDVATRYELPNPILRAAPTGVAAHAISGKTLHSLLRLPIRSKEYGTSGFLQPMRHRSKRLSNRFAI